MVIVGIITLFMFAMVGFGPRFLEKIMPERVLVWIDDNDGFGGLFSLSGTFNMMDSGAAKGDPNDPDSYLRAGKDGWIATPKIAALPGNKAAFVKDVLEGRRRDTSNVAPASVGRLSPVTDCRLTAPNAGSLVAHIGVVGSRDAALALATYGDAELAEAVRNFAKVYRKTGLKQVQGLSNLRFTNYDVVVTETEKPVYLVLEATGYHRLWTIHLAPGAQIERVVLLGGAQVGVANLDPDVPVEVLRNAELDACGIPQAVYPLPPGHMLFQSLEAGLLPQEEADATLAEIAAATTAYDRWFRASFGVKATETLTGNWRDGTIAVAGPVPADPAARAKYTPVAEAAARITTDTYVEYPALKAKGEDFATRVVAIATAFAGGDLKSIQPEVSF